MELFDYLLSLLAEQSDMKVEEIDSVRASLIDAVELRQYTMLRNEQDQFVGFVTWELQGGRCGITNLLIIKELRGSYNLKRVISFLRREYPNVRFTWHNRKRDRIFRQREALCAG